VAIFPLQDVAFEEFFVGKIERRFQQFADWVKS
jgi:hypothetical protein